MADVNGVFLWYQCFKKLLCVVFLSLIYINQASALVCYCAGHCPHNQPNGSCFARPDSQCFSAVERVYNEETNLMEDERTYGCLPPEENGFMQCKGHLVPHEIPKSIACCSSGDWCNKFLKPNTVQRTTTPSPMYQGELLSYTGPYNAATCITAVSVCFAILGAVLVLMILRCRKDKQTQRNYMNVEKGINGDAVKGLMDKSEASGSGSGFTLLVQRTIGKELEMLESIGRGRFGEVWKARYRDQLVAVKVFFTSEEPSWSREKEIYNTALLRHDNILGYVASDIRGNGSWTQMLLITDYLSLGSLHDYLKEAVLDLSTMLKLAHSASCGLAHLHVEVSGKQGKTAIAHRDIKSRNILVKRDISCVIADFGLAVKYKCDTNELDVAENTRVGTRRYMSPEVLDETIDGSQFEAYRCADMYSFALVLWEIARRCKVDGIVEEYQLPYYDCVPTNPSFEDMKKVVCVDQTRPAIPTHWSSCETMQVMSKVIQESWKQNPGARLTALRVKKTLGKLEVQHKDLKTA
ncbi:hypothetical protein CDAR_72271 [Caerostris darwini]|uniref:Serine/threonine-protein kinase receptor n=1 Tax=Caerostris darwini TaxID=1538125 RepID=A0AAV4MK92_9ARAC|nr:hypothetical protein CDAR_72101 [Caerostris darwini]GIX72826.1 hypothetical protein CDAR_72271 [Caerostris darwini]